MDLHDPTEEENLIIKTKFRRIGEFKKAPSIFVLLMWLISYIITVVHVIYYVNKYRQPVNLFYITGIYVLILLFYLCFTGIHMITYFLCRHQVLYTYCSGKDIKNGMTKSGTSYVKFACISIQEQDAKKYRISRNYTKSKWEYNMCEKDDMVMVVCWNFLGFRFSELIERMDVEKLSDEVRAERNYGPNKSCNGFMFWENIRQTLQGILITLLFNALLFQLIVPPVKYYEEKEVNKKRQEIRVNVFEKTALLYKMKHYIEPKYPEYIEIDGVEQYEFSAYLLDLGVECKGYTDEDGNIYQDNIAFYYYAETLLEMYKAELDSYFDNYELLFCHSGYIPFKFSDDFDDYYSVISSEPNNTSVWIYVNEESQQNITEAVEHLKEQNVGFSLHFYDASDGMIDNMKRLKPAGHIITGEETNRTVIEYSLNVNLEDYNHEHEIYY